MSVIPQLASSLGHRDEVPNQELARRIAATGNTAAVRELVENLSHKDKNIQSDCIKTLDEIGVHTPQLLLPYIDTFVALLAHKNNRLQWGAMAVLDEMTPADPQLIFDALGPILAAADKGSVITKDRAVHILVRLTEHTAYAENTFPLLLEQLLSCPGNQLPMYAEQCLPVVPEGGHERLKKVLQTRMPELDKESKRKRVEKVLRKLG